MNSSLGLRDLDDGEAKPNRPGARRGCDDPNGITLLPSVMRRTSNNPVETAMEATFIENRTSDESVDDVMRQRVVAVQSETTIKRAASVVAHKKSQLLGRRAGEYYHRRVGFQGQGPESSCSQRRSSKILIHDVMSTRVITLGPSADESRLGNSANIGTQ